MEHVSDTKVPRIKIGVRLNACFHNERFFCNAVRTAAGARIGALLRCSFDVPELFIELLPHNMSYVVALPPRHGAFNTVHYFLPRIFAQEFSYRYSHAIVCWGLAQT